MITITQRISDDVKIIYTKSEQGNIYINADVNHGKSGMKLFIGKLIKGHWIFTDKQTNIFHDLWNNHKPELKKCIKLLLY